MTDQGPTIVLPPMSQMPPAQAPGPLTPESPAVPPLPAGLTTIEQQRQNLLSQLKDSLSQEENLKTNLDQLSQAAQTIESKKAELTKQLEQLNQQEANWYSQHTAQLQPLLHSPAVTTTAVPSTSPTVATPAPIDRLALVKQTLVDKLTHVPPQGIATDQLERVLTATADFFLSPDLNGIIVRHGQEQIHIASADLIAAGALVDLTLLPKLQ
ncbi:MAG: hypothetical protein HYV33_04960 [Candidatus Kerfeldbacteria bacterium]|nr:hypothetical protein [Candidatus Kerfeldbacteria bacterium]